MSELNKVALYSFIIVLPVVWAVFFAPIDELEKRETNGREPVSQSDMLLFSKLFVERDLDSVEIVIRRRKSAPFREGTEKQQTPEARITTYKQLEEVNNDLSDDEVFFKEMIQNYKENVLRTRKYRNDVVIRYYKHDQDQEKAKILNEFGFYLHERPVSKYRKSTLRSNTIHYGEDFPLRDIQLIAYLLLENGVEIKRIAPFKNYGGWKHKSIEIGADASLKKATSLSLSDIRNYAKR